jgi:hypothetical protein
MNGQSILCFFVELNFHHLETGFLRFWLNSVFDARVQCVGRLYPCQHSLPRFWRSRSVSLLAVIIVLVTCRLVLCGTLAAGLAK